MDTGYENRSSMPTQLKAISTNAGFLEGAKVEFAPGLTCIIGARGTCKSTLIETIRFVFDHDASRVAQLIAEPQDPSANDSPRGLVHATLGAGTATCTVVQKDVTGHEYVLEREVGADTRIFADGVREHTDRAILQDIEIFSQGDLQRIAHVDNDDLRLRLIDRANRDRVDALQQERASAANRLMQRGERLRAVHVQMSSLRLEVAQLDGFQSQLNRARSSAPAATPELDAERISYERRQQLLEILRGVERDRATIAAEVMAAMSPAADLGQAVVTLTSADEPAVRELDGVLRAVAEGIGRLRATVVQLGDSSLAAAIQTVAARFESQSERYYLLRREQQEVNESLKMQQNLQRQIDHLVRQKAALEKLEIEESGLLVERRELRRELSRIDDELFELRTREIDTINTEHGDTIQLSLSSGAATAEYTERLSRMLSGSRIRSQEEVARALAEKLAPSALIDIVESTNAQQLATILERDLSQMMRVVTHLSDHAELYALECEVPSAKLRITMYDGGVPKPVESLSEGQRATALLPIILRKLPYPLLIDQPEDDLDNKFIFQSLIKIVETLKAERQVIFVTHNANIPVLGAADRVIVMRMDTPTKAASPLSGTVDERKQDILELLEGGAAAFQAREQRYHDILVGRV